MTVWPLLFLLSTCDPEPARNGKQQFDQGRFAEAEGHFRRAMEEACGPAEQLAGRINLAATLRERNRPAEAREVLGQAGDLAQIPVAVQVQYWNSWGLLEDQAGRAAAAEAAYRRAMALLTPATPARLTLQLWTNSARLHLRAGRLAEADEALRQARQTPGWQQERPIAYDLNLAELRRVQGKRREAETVLRALLARAPEMAAQTRGAIHNNLASLVAARGAHREAEGHWREAESAFREAYGTSHPTVAKQRSNLAAYYVSRKRYAEAETLYREAIAMDEHPLLLNNLGVLLHQRGRAGEAEELYRRAVALWEKRTQPAPEALRLHGNLALLLVETKRGEESLAHFRMVVELLPLAAPAEEEAAARYLEQYERMLRARREAAEAERVAALAMRYRVRTALREED